MHVYRTHHCAELRAQDAGSKARLSGWVHRKRNHGQLLFIDLRDHHGLTQSVVDTESPLFEDLEALSLESVITVTGQVIDRTPETVNPALPTGAVELRIEGFEVQSRANPLPMPVNQDAGYPEDIRLRYRFLDLRRPDLHDQIVLRSRVIGYLRQRMGEAGFLEYQTPILTASSPEGARDFLVPSRIHPGQFYALPQAPQQFKQLLMIAGFDRYFQIAPCFRDEDSRADRSPGEFYQLDFEMSFVTQDDVFEAIEPVLYDTFSTFANGRTVSPAPFVRIPYREALARYGSDKPDLRNPLTLCDVSEVFKDSSFKVFAGIVAKGGEVQAVLAKGAGEQPRKFFDDLNSWARTLEQPGLGYIAWKADGTAAGPIAKNLSEDSLKSLEKTLGAEPGDAVFFAAGPKQGDATKLFAGQIRTRLGTLLDLIDPEHFAFCWIVDFPMFEWDETAQKIDFSHNPFSMPQGGLKALQEQDPLDILAYQYDIVCNGIELSSGAIRNHLPEVMYKAFEIAGHDPAVVDTRFGGMINALKLGAPPHGGSAPGIDRIVMLLAGASNIREIIAFPMNQTAQDLMMGAPAPVSERQLRDVHISLDIKDT